VRERCGDDGIGCGEQLTEVFGLLGKRWTGLIISVLLQRPARFAELARAVPGISERMLSDRLAELAGARLVDRQVSDGPPVSVTYRHTECGEGLRPALAELQRWAEASYSAARSAADQSTRG
jgi:DNA-binding HxlR family transcriptional regulator